MEKQDEVFALWNYTRALYSFGKKGKSKESNKLLKRAIEKNPHVPPLLLSWEISSYSPVFMLLGGPGEGTDYIRDNAQYWFSSALEWIEEIYCETTGIRQPITNSTARAHIKGTKLMTEAQNVIGAVDTNAIRAAIDEFESLLDFLDRSVSSQKRLRKEVLQRKGICHGYLGEHTLAIRHLNSALCLCKPTDKEAIKMLYYSRAASKEEMGDLRGAYDDFKFVYQNIDNPSTAFDGIRRLEKRLNIQNSAIPTPNIDYSGIDDSIAEVKAFEHTICQMLPRNKHSDSAAGSQERCTQCGRGGMRLFECSGCKDSRYKFCSKECLADNWRVLHKYICAKRKHRLDPGVKVRLRKLNNASYNEKEATVVSFQEKQGRFCVQLVCSDGESPKEIAVKPTNLKRLTK